MAIGEGNVNGPPLHRWCRSSQQEENEEEDKELQHPTLKRISYDGSYTVCRRFLILYKIRYKQRFLDLLVVANAIIC